MKQQEYRDDLLSINIIYMYIYINIDVISLLRLYDVDSIDIISLHSNFAIYIYYDYTRWTNMMLRLY
jgi:hypothetical protein